ncbi:MAG TPA: ABC transporter permease [Mollicutes bacterium]|nr:ABC transporter permease [Mollicutes bacterium]
MIGRDIRDAIKSVFRNFSLSMASISCISITLILVGLAILSSYNVDHFTKLIEQDFSVFVYLDKDITDEEIAIVEEELKKNNNIVQYDFDSKEEIAQSMMETSDVLRNIMEKWEEDENPLNDVFRLKLKDIREVKTTAQKLEKMDNVSLVDYGEKIVNNFIIAFDVIEKILIIVVLLFIVVTAFLIANTIKLAIFSRRREIEIMRLVGASNFNIELPFIVEGLILGIFGSIIPIIIVIYGYFSFYIKYDGQFFSPFMRLVVPEPFVYIVSLILVSIGIIVGMMGSLRAVRKYLKI